jgi:hypothetical protein
MIIAQVPLRADSTALLAALGALDAACAGWGPMLGRFRGIAEPTE